MESILYMMSFFCILICGLILYFGINFYDKKSFKENTHDKDEEVTNAQCRNCCVVLEDPVEIPINGVLVTRNSIFNRAISVRKREKYVDNMATVVGIRTFKFDYVPKLYNYSKENKRRMQAITAAFSCNPDFLMVGEVIHSDAIKIAMAQIEIAMSQKTVQQQS